MILTPTPLQRPALQNAIVRPLRAGMPSQPRAAAAVQPVLRRATRAPQQLSLDLQPRR